jgi:hypothetical protein
MKIVSTAGFTGQDGDGMPRIVDCLATPMAAGMFRDAVFMLS